MTRDEYRELFKDVVSMDTKNAREVALEYALDTLIRNPGDSFEAGFEACAEEYLYGAASEE